MNYNELISNVIYEKFVDDLKASSKGHCMKLTGVSDEILLNLQDKFSKNIQGLDCFILNETNRDDKYINATKLVELRNLQEKPLLILCPSNLRTAAEDSFGNATFKELDIDDAEHKLLLQLLKSTPSDFKTQISTIREFLGGSIADNYFNNYLIALNTSGFTDENIGNLLFHLGLIPDSILVKEIPKIRARLNFNSQCMEILTSFNETVFDRVNQLPIKRDTLQKRIAEFLKNSKNCRSSFSIGKSIFDNSPELNFSNWSVAELDNLRTLKVSVLDLAGVRDSLKRDLDGKLVLLGQKDKPVKLKIKFTTDPLPTNAHNLKYFQIDLMRPIGPGEYEKVIEMDRFENSNSARNYRTKDLEFDINTIEEGNYFLKLIALDVNNNQLNIDDDFQDKLLQKEWEKEKEEQRDKADKSKFKGKLTCDSESFLYTVEEGDEEEDPVGIERKEKISNILQGYFTYKIDYLKKREDSSQVVRDDEDWKWLNPTKQSLHYIFHAKYSDAKYNFQVEVSAKLKAIQKMILSEPEKLGTCRIHLSTTGLLDDNAISITESISKENAPAAFLAKRKILFEAIKNSVPDGEGIFETFELYKHRDLVEDYINEYLIFTTKITERLKSLKENDEEGKRQIKQAVYALQNLDLVQLKTKLPNQEPITAYLISPLHPLRLGWFASLCNLFEEWESKTREYWNYLEYWTDQLQSLFLGELYPTNNPLVLSEFENLNSYEYVGELCFGWGAYLKSVFIEKDLESMSSRNRLILQYVQQLLNIRTSANQENDIDFKVVYAHVKKYLALHPYTEQININLFNVGEGAIFSDVLIELEKDKALRNYRYEVRLFTNSDKIISNGESLIKLLNPESNLSEEAESFSQATRNRLFPKLRLSINNIHEFITVPEKFDAHLSFLVNPFPLRTIVYNPKNQLQSFYLNSLIVEPQVEVNISEDRSSFSWARFITTNEDSNPSALSKKLIQCFSNLNYFIAYSLSGTATDSTPATELVLLNSDTVLIDKIHQHSDWVITFDRHLGPEVFDLPNVEGQIPFLLDYIPGESVLGVSTFLTTKPSEEIETIISPYLEKIYSKTSSDYNLSRAILEDLRTVSGSIILQLNSNPNRVVETIGIALTKRLLEKKGILNSQFLVPIDLHQYLFKEQEQNQNRADLLLVEIDTEARKINIQIVEIKSRSEALTLANRDAIKAEMDFQMQNTIEVLKFHFEGNKASDTDRFDRPIKNKELSNLLSFYIERAQRYGLLSQEDKENYLRFITTFEKGFDFTFSKKGVVFELEGDFYIQKEHMDTDLMYFFIGKRAIKDIIDPNSDLNSNKPSADTAIIPESFSKGKKKNVLFDDDILNEKSDEVRKEMPLKSTLDSSPIIEDKSSVQDLPSKEIVQESSELAKSFDPPAYDIYIGDNKPSTQYGILGNNLNNKKIALDLNSTNTISLFGIQGAGKSYTIGSITEMVLKSFQNVNSIQKPLAGVIFHYSESQDYKPEFTSMVYPNSKENEIRRLKELYGANPDNLDDVILLVPKAKILERIAENSGMEVLPISFSSSELSIMDWKFLMGAVNNQALYMKHINSLMRGIRHNITVKTLENAIANTNLLNTGQKELAFARLNLAKEYIDDNAQLGSLIKPGKLIIVDLRDEFIEHDDALGLFVIMLNIFANARLESGHLFNKFIVFDEAHKYMGNKALTENIVTAIREMRHKGVSLLIASQDPPSLPNEIIELSSILIMHKFNSPQWLKHIQKSIMQTGNLMPNDLANLNPGEAFIWSAKSNTKSITQQPMKVITRPRITLHGGGTIKATE